MNTNISFFLPTRKGSQRVKNKNTRPFSSYGGGILELKLKQLMASELITEVILSTNDERSVDVAKKIDPFGKCIKVIVRPEHLCQDDTPLSELIKYVPSITSCSHILWGHVTTPFNDAGDYDEGIRLYFVKLSEGFDSLISVYGIQNFLMDEFGQFVNFKLMDGQWPRTQDLSITYEVNHAMFIASRNVYEKYNDRIGKKPFLYCQDKIKSFDIDWEEEFLIAEAIYDKLYKV